jgi:hypothetical protein
MNGPRIWLLAAALLLAAAQSGAQTSRYVCAAGDATCGGTPAYSTLSAAITAAAASDTIYLKSGETFTGNFTLPVKTGCTTYDCITITTLFSGAPTLPAAGDRICPTGSDAITEGYCTSNIDPDILARIQPTQVSGSQNEPAILLGAGAVGWSIKLVRMTNGMFGSGVSVRVGQSSSSVQPNRAAQPSFTTIDQVYFDYDTYHPYWGQKRAIELQSKAAKVTNNYIEGSDQPSSAGDGSAILMYSGEGPYTITNNWLRGGTEIVMSMGDTPQIRTTATWSGTPTTTSGTLTWGAGLTPNGDCPFVGQVIVPSVNGATAREYVTVATVSNCTATTADVTWSPAISGTLDTPGDVRWGVVPGDCALMASPCSQGILFEYNVVSRNLAHKAASIIPEPTTLSATGNTGGGSLADGAWSVYVSARMSSQGQTINSGAVGPVTATVGASGTISWSVAAMHADVTTYRVTYTLDGTTFYYTDFSTNSGTVTAATTTTTTPPTGTSRRYKALFELKGAIDALITHNYFFNSWNASAGDGTAFWIKAVNQAASLALPSANNNHPWMENRDSVFEENVVRGVTKFFKVSGWEYENNNAYYKPVGTSGLIVRNMLAFDVTTVTYGGSGASGIQINNGCSACTFEHLTLDVTTSFALEPNSAANRDNVLSDGFTFRNNMLVRNATSGGIKASGIAEGTLSISGAEGTNGGAYTVNRNVWGNRASGPTSGAYPEHNTASPVGNVFVAYDTTWKAQFDNYESATILGYVLDAGSAYLTAASDGGPIGVTDIATLNDDMTKALSGLGTVDPMDPPPDDPGGIGPTRFYFSSQLWTGAIPTLQDNWNTTAAQTVYHLSNAPANTPIAASLAAVSTATTPEFHVTGLHISRELTAQTIGGTVKCQIRGRESAAGMDATLAIGLYVITPVGAVRGVLLAPTAADTLTAANELFVTTGTSRNRACRDATESASITLTPVAVQEGDRLVIVTGCRDASTSTTSTCTLVYSDNVETDLIEGDTDVASPDNPWVEIGDGILFVEPVGLRLRLRLR